MNFSHYYGFDTENDKTGKVTLTALAKEDGTSKVWKRAGRLREWIDQNTEDSPVIYCHNAEYDLNNEFGTYYPYLNLTYNKGRFISAKYRHVTFYDSFNHYRTSLEKIGTAFGLEKKAFDIHDPQYVLTDAQIPVVAMAATRKYIEAMGGKLGATAGSSAVSVWRYMTGDEFMLGPLDNKFLRRGYAGGRSEIFRSHAFSDPLLDKDGNVQYKNYGCWDMGNWVEEREIVRQPQVRGYDVNSMYPACMMGYFPMLWGDDKGMRKIYGMAEATVSVPHDHTVGPLFWRSPEGRLSYPVGRFRGVWTYEELRYLQEIGGKIITLHRAFGGSHADKPFDQYVETLYALRLAETDTAKREVIKILLNSLYGKLCTGGKVTRSVSKFNLIRNYPNNPKILDQVTWIDNNRGFMDFDVPAQGYVNVLWGATITARARILLTKHLRSVPPEKLIYCDTDSIYTLKHEMPTGTGLGALKLEGAWGVMKVKQPKAYSRDHEYKAKGVPKPKRDEDGNIVIDYAKQYLEEGMTEFSAPVRFRESIRRLDVEPNQWIQKSRSLSTEYKSKRLSNFRYFPAVVGEQQEFNLGV